MLPDRELPLAPTNWLKSRQFENYDASWEVYSQLQDMVKTKTVDMSVFRISLPQEPSMVVVVLGETALGRESEKMIDDLLFSGGKECILPVEVEENLRNRRREVMRERMGEYTEFHHS